MAKKPTFLEARLRIFDALTRHGWSLATVNYAKMTPMKVPHATSPNGSLRFWFQPQAVWYTTTDSRDERHDFKNARTLSYSLDIREEDPEDFANWADKQSLKA